ncbi:MAG: 1,4-alpha-glucan branching protein, partial [Meiothermus sp.]
MTRFVLVLHAHLPYVRAHGMWPFGEETLYDVLAEVYLPLARMLERLEHQGIPTPLTLGITPVLSEQLADPRVKEGFLRYASDRLARAEGDLGRYRDTEFEAGAGHNFEFWQTTLEHYRNLGGDLTGFFARAQERGRLEIVTSSATHAYSPLLSSDAALWAQVKTGTETYRQHYRRAPTG